MQMQFHKNDGSGQGHGHGHGHGHHHPTHSMPTYNYYYTGPTTTTTTYPWFRYPSGNSWYYSLYGDYDRARVIEYVPTNIRTNTSKEMEILSRVYLGGVGLVGLLILYNLMDKK